MLSFFSSLSFFLSRSKGGGSCDGKDVLAGEGEMCLLLGVVIQCPFFYSPCVLVCLFVCLLACCNGCRASYGAV